MSCNPANLVTTYYAGADPSVVNSTGNRYFGTNQGGTIYQSNQQPQVALAVTQTGQPPASVPIQ